MNKAATKFFQTKFDHSSETMGTALVTVHALGAENTKKLTEIVDVRICTANIGHRIFLGGKGGGAGPTLGLSRALTALQAAGGAGQEAACI